MKSRAPAFKTTLRCGCHVILFLLASHVCAQQTTPSLSTNSPLFPNDSVATASIKNLFITRKNFKRGIHELFAAELFPWTYNRFVRKADFAKISLSSIGQNLQPRNWQWDDNKFINNHISHPYHGSFYFNAFRTNGFDFWRSVPGSFAGTIFWELVCETHYPAPNDLINTSLGGIALGELTYRLSNALVNTRGRGLKKHMAHGLAFMVNPLNSFNRWADKKRNLLNYHPANGAGFFAETDFGSRQYANRSNNETRKWKHELFTSINLEYGDPFKDLKTPFGSFLATIEAGTSPAELNMVRVKAPLIGWRLKEAPQISHVANLLFSYDFYRNLAFSYSAESFHLNLVSKFKKGILTDARTNLGAGIIALAAVPNEYLYYGEGRNYDYGCGLGLAAAGRFVFSNRLVHVLQYRRGWFRTINGFNSTYYLGTTNSEIKYKLRNNLSIAFEWGAYFLRGKYVGYDNVNKRYTYVRFSTELGFSL